MENKNNKSYKKKMLIIIINLILFMVGILFVWFVKQRNSGDLQLNVVDTIKLLDSYTVEDISKYDQNYYILGVAHTAGESQKILKENNISDGVEKNYQKFNYMYLKIINDGTYSTIEPAKYIYDNNDNAKIQFSIKTTEQNGKYTISIYEIPMSKTMKSGKIDISFESKSKDVIRYDVLDPSSVKNVENNIFNYLGTVKSEEEYTSLLNEYEIKRENLQDINTNSYNYVFISISNTDCSSVIKFMGYRETEDILNIDAQREIMCAECEMLEPESKVYALPVEKNVIYDIQDIQADVKETNPNNCVTSLYYIISFDSSGGNAIGDKVVKGDINKFGELPMPTKKGYKFLGWYYNDKKVDADTKINTDVLLKAKWERIENKVVEVNPPVNDNDKNKQEQPGKICVSYAELSEKVSLYNYQIEGGNEKDCIKAPNADWSSSDFMKDLNRRYGEMVREDYAKSHDNINGAITLKQTIQSVKHEGVVIGYLISYKVSSAEMKEVTYTLSCESSISCQVTKIIE